MGRVKDFLTRALFAVAAVWGMHLSWQLHKEISSRQQQQANYPKYGDFSLSAGICMGFIFAQLLFKRLFNPVANMMIPKKARWSYMVWGVKVQRCSDAVFKCTYYLVMTVWGLSVLRSKPWVPWVLGGAGRTSDCWADGYPFQPVAEDLKVFYLTAIGYHLCEILLHLMETRHPDFWEMLLHHTVTCYLVTFSYGLNYMRVGSLVMVLHGATDIFIYASKALVDTSFMRCTAASYIALVVSYAWFRIYVLPMYVMHSAWVESVQVAGKELTGWGFMNFSLSVLLLLHMYWFSLIIRIGFNFRRTGEARDLQANLSAMDMQEKKKE